MRETLLSFNAPPLSYVTSDCEFEGHSRFIEQTTFHNGRHGWGPHVNEACLDCTVVGRFCSIGPGAMIGLHTHPVDHLSNKPTFCGFHYTVGSGLENTITMTEAPAGPIGSDLWVATRSLILIGAFVSYGTIMAAVPMETKNNASFAIVGEHPPPTLYEHFSDALAAYSLEPQFWKLPIQTTRACSRICQAPLSFNLLRGNITSLGNESKPRRC